MDGGSSPGRKGKGSPFGGGRKNGTRKRQEEGSDQGVHNSRESKTHLRIRRPAAKEKIKHGPVGREEEKSGGGERRGRTTQKQREKREG